MGGAPTEVLNNIYRYVLLDGHNATYSTSLFTVSERIGNTANKFFREENKFVCIEATNEFRELLQNCEQLFAVIPSTGITVGMAHSSVATIKLVAVYPNTTSITPTIFKIIAGKRGLSFTAAGS